VQRFINEETFVMTRYSKAFVIAAVALICCGVVSANAQSRAHAISGSIGHSAVAHGTGSWHGGNWNGGNRGNWTGGNWGRYHHHHHSNVFFDVGFGYPFWGYPYWDYPYGYYPYGSGYYDGYGYDQPVVQGQYVGGDGNNGGSLVAQVQRRLARAGFYHGAVDGVAGSGTRRAVRAYERAHGLPVDGVIDNQLLATMGLSYARR
jgi:hypothetical protein